VQGDSRLQAVSDVLGFNLYFGWYYGDFDSLATFLDTYHARHPARPLFVSEYGAGSDERVHTMEPQAFDFSIEYQQRFHESHLPMLRERPYLVGYAVWNQFDFGSAGRQDTKPGINQKGLYFFDRAPKDVAYFYHASLRPEPVVWIATRDWRRRAGSRPEDRRQPVVVYANSSEVELELDGESLGRQRLANAAARWIVPFQHGPNLLRARARRRRDGEVVEDSVAVYYEDRTMLFAGAGAEPAARVLAVNAGAHYQFVDRQGVVWEADRPYEPGSWGYIEEGRTRRTHHAIQSTADEPLFQATREGAPLEYRFDVPDGTYEVQLLFAEIEHDEAGARTFSVHVNGNPVISDLDLIAQDGRYVAAQRTIEVTAVDGAGIDILLRPTTGTAAISGISIGRL
jgi:beta-galactosidase